MSQLIHGHQVMEMIAESENIYTKPILKTEIAIKFGENIRFHTCMCSDLTADQLIEFLVSKGKIFESTEGIIMNEDFIC